MNNKIESNNDIYQEYGIYTDDDTDDEINTKISRPSTIINEHISLKQSDENSDTDSDGYTDNNYISISRRRPSFIKTSLTSFSSRIRISPGHIKKTFKDKEDDNTYFYIIKSIIFTPILFFINCLGLAKKSAV